MTRSRWLALGAGAVLAAVRVVAVVAASPSPNGGAGDPRSSGQGPGLVGDPAFALLAVMAIGIASVVLTLIWVRLTNGRRS